MTIVTQETYTCDGCGKTVYLKPYGWAAVFTSSTYETDLGLISVGPDRNRDYCGECWAIMKAALEPEQAEPTGPTPASWWAKDKDGVLTKVYRSYADYCWD